MTRPKTQADGSSRPLNEVETPSPPARKRPLEPPADPDPGDEHVAPADEHLGATEDEVSDTPAPAGEYYKDEPRQG